MSTGTICVRSPIHVGGSEGSVSAEEFAHLGERLYRISTLALETWLRDNNLVTAYLSAIESSVGTPFSLVDFLRTVGADVSDVLKVAAYAIASPAGAAVAHLRPFCRDPDGLAYLPGSSIKGALRTGVLAQELQSRQELRRVLVHGAEHARGGSRTASREAERVAFARARYPGHLRTTPQNQDLWRFVRVGDSEPLRPEDVALLEVQVWNLRRDGSSYVKQRVYAECLLPGVEVRFPFRIDVGGVWAADIRGGWTTPAGIMSAAARWAQSVWRDEAAAMEGLGLTDTLASFYRGAPAGIRLGWGSGWHSLGVGRLLPENLQRQLASRSAEGLPFPKSRKVVVVGSIESMPLGWGDLALG